MNYILLIGGIDSGKSTTMTEVVKRLSPTKVFRVHFRENSEVELHEIVLETELFNGTFIIEVNGIIILIVAGAPTEQKITITVIIASIRKLISIDFAIISMRSIERRPGHDTKNELKALGTCILEETIVKIENDAFKKTSEWLNRIKRIVNNVQK